MSKESLFIQAVISAQEEIGITGRPLVKILFFLTNIALDNAECTLEEKLLIAKEFFNIYHEQPTGEDNEITSNGEISG